MKGTMGFSAFAMFVFVVAFSCVIRDGLADRAAKAENREFREFSGKKHLKPLPFTGESAKIASNVWLFSHPGVVPAVRLNDNLKGVDQTWAELALSRILTYAYRAKLALSERSTKLTMRADFLNDTHFAEFTRLIFRFWMSLLSGFVFIFLMILTRRRTVALFGGVAHALMPAALFGAALELSPANFALPVVAATFVFGVWHLKNPSWRKASLAGAALMVAATIWSGAWTLFFFWGLAESLRIAMGGASDQKRKELWLSLNVAAFVATIIIAVIGDFSFFDVLLGSPFVITGPAVLAAQWLPASFALRGRPIRVAALLGLFVMIWIAAANLADSDSYLNDQRTLLALKTRFLNVKPHDPDLLTFSERALWSSAERSPTPSAIAALFPILPVFALATSLAALFLEKTRTKFMRWSAVVSPAPSLALLSFASFLFFERTSSATAFFCAVFAGCVLAFWSKKGTRLTVREGATALSIFLGTFLLWSLMLSGVSPTPIGILQALSILLSALVVLLLLATVLGWIIKVLNKKHDRVPFASSLVFVLSATLLAVDAESLSSSTIGFMRNQKPRTAKLIRWMSSEGVENVKFLCDPALSPLIESYCGAVSLFPRIPRKAVSSTGYPPSPLSYGGRGRRDSIKNLNTEETEARKGKTTNSHTMDLSEYEKYLDAMFHGTERELAEFCAKHGVRYLIFDVRNANSKSLYGARYLASAAELEPRSPAKLMGSIQKRAELRCFYEIVPSSPAFPETFIVFKVVTRKDRSDALKWALESERLARDGKRWMAARLAKSAIFADPNCVQADIMYRKLHGRPPVIRLRGY